MAHYAIDKSAIANELRFHYRDWGGHGWPVLLLHEAAATSHSWDLTAPLLVEEARVIAMDLRGHGRSDKPDSAYTFEEVGGDVLTLLEALSFERPVLVGHGWGANVALWLAATQPDQISGLILVDGALIDLRNQSWDEMLRRFGPPKSTPVAAEEFRETLVARAPQGLISPAVEAAILANYEIDSENLLHRRLPAEYHLRLLKAMWEQPLADLYRKLTCPVLMLPARWEGREDQDHITLNQKGAEQAEALLADVEVIWLEKSIHDLPLQRPHRLAEEILRFLHDRL